MAGNKHALTRYKVLDACFSNSIKKYFVEDLIEKCNEALTERYPSKEVGVSRRTFFDDLNDLDELVSEYGVEIIRINEGKRKYYRYSEPGFSLFTKGFTEEELISLKETVETLQRFKGLPSFQWMTSLVNKLEDKLTIKTTVNNILSYEDNSEYAGIDWLKDCFDSIINQQPLKVNYRSFDDKSFEWTIHPYYIKQYNNRWFLIGWNPEYNNLTNIPLDRIDDIVPTHVDFIPNKNIDFDRYFEDVIGVTVNKKPAQKVTLRFTPKRLQYILTKPIHKSQVCIDIDKGLVAIKVIINKELEALLLSFGPDVEVIEPQTLRDLIQDKIKNSYDIYFSCAD